MKRTEQNIWISLKISNIKIYFRYIFEPHENTSSYLLKDVLQGKINIQFRDLIDILKDIHRYCQRSKRYLLDVPVLLGRSGRLK